jgi:1-deoxy-D-xylulose-5-phosphate reductoisomerase
MCHQVEAFLKDGIGFLEMSDVIERTMNTVSFIKTPAYEDYVASDKEARIVAKEMLIPKA